MAAPVFETDFDVDTALYQEHTSAVGTITFDSADFTTINAGDLMIAIVATPEGRNLVEPTGWTEIADIIEGGALRFGCWWREYESGDTTYDWDLTNYDGKCNGALFRITGHKSGDPFDPTATTDQDTSTQTDWPAITTTVDECLIVRCLARNDTGFVTIPATTQLDEQPTGLNQLGIHTQEKTTAGTVAAEDASNATPEHWCTISLGIQPAAAAAVVNPSSLTLLGVGV